MNNNFLKRNLVGIFSILLLSSNVLAIDWLKEKCGNVSQHVVNNKITYGSLMIAGGVLYFFTQANDAEIVNDDGWEEASLNCPEVLEARWRADSDHVPYLNYFYVREGCEVMYTVVEGCARNICEIGERMATNLINMGYADLPGLERELELREQNGDICEYDYVQYDRKVYSQLGHFTFKVAKRCLRTSLGH